MTPKIKKIIFISIVVITIIVGVYTLVIKPKQDDKKAIAKAEEENAAKKTTGGGSAPKASVASTDPSSKYTPVAVFDNANPIKQGMQGKQVVQLQKYLNKNNKAGLETDGLWGPGTQAAFEAAKFLMTEGANAGKTYGVLTVGLYNKLGLSSY